MADGRGKGGGCLPGLSLIHIFEGGTTIDDALDVARLVAAQGVTDYINTSIGVATASLFMIEASMACLLYTSHRGHVVVAARKDSG